MQHIGIIRSPFTELADMPIQPKGAADITGTIIIATELERGLDDIEGFSHLYLLYLFHRVQRTELSVVPFMDDKPRGIFSTRSPLRPNHIGLSIVELLGRDKNVLAIRGVDILDGTPLIDIKPYIAQFDEVGVSRSGWLSATAEEIRRRRSDNRFI